MQSDARWTFQGPRLPWWRVGMVWLVLAGPAVVVVAALLTAAVAWHGADVVVSAVGPGAVMRHAPEAPAVQARNHASTAAAPPTAPTAPTTPTAPVAR